MNAEEALLRRLHDSRGTNPMALFGQGFLPVEVHVLILSPTSMLRDILQKKETFIVQTFSRRPWPHDLQQAPNSSPQSQQLSVPP